MLPFLSPLSATIDYFQCTRGRFSLRLPSWSLVTSSHREIQASPCFRARERTSPLLSAVPRFSS